MYIPAGTRFLGGISLLSQKAYHLVKSLQCDYLVFSSVSLVVLLPRQSEFGCSTFIVFRRWEERPNEIAITVGIGWVLLASATSRFSGYIKLAYCSSAKGLQ